VGNSRRKRWRGSLPHGVEQWQFEIVGTSVLSSQIHSQTENLQRVPTMNMGAFFFLLERVLIYILKSESKAKGLAFTNEKVTE